MNVITILWTISEYFLHTYFPLMLPSSWLLMCQNMCDILWQAVCLQLYPLRLLVTEWTESTVANWSSVLNLSPSSENFIFFLFYPKPDLCVFGLGSLYLRQFNFWLNNCSLTQRPRAIKKHWKHFLTLSHESGYLWGALLHGGLAQIRQELSK